MLGLERRIWLFLIVGIIFPSPVFIKAQSQTDTTTITLQEVALQAPKIETVQNKLPFSLSVKDLTSFQAIYQQLSLQEYLGSVPGLFTQNANNYAQDLRISLRGFGSRAAFGIRGVKIIVDGIPETTPDGQGQLDNIPLGLLKSFEVLRGPSASLYGNASGGVIYLKTLDKLDDKAAQFKVIFGSYEFQSYQLATSLENEKTEALIHANKTQTNGFRKNSGFEQNLFNIKVKHLFTSQSSLQLQLNYTNSPIAQDAGGLTLEETESNWDQARQRNVDYNTYESVDHFKAGLRWQQNWRSQWDLDTYGFYSYRDFHGKLPFENGGIIDLNRNYFGFGSLLNYKQEKHLWQIGIESSSQQDQRDRFFNLKGIQGEQSFSQLESFRSLGIYILDEVQWKKLLLRTSLRYDDLSLGADSIFEDQKYQVLNPSIGLSYEIDIKQRLFVNFSSSFETPTLSELSSNPSGKEGLNLELNPSRALNYEIGWKGLWAKMRIEANLFFIESSNEILPYELEAFPGRSFYRNTGATERFGFEFSGIYKTKAWEVQASITQARYEFSKNESLEGNAIPGIPNSQFFLQVGYLSPTDWKLQLTGESIGRFYADNKNSVQIDAYQKVRLQGGKTISFGDVEANLFAGLNNLFNVRYFDNIRLNAFGKRYYEPAPGRNIFFGVSAEL
jgi:iron complex outermembrane receptor protein